MGAQTVMSASPEGHNQVTGTPSGPQGEAQNPTEVGKQILEGNRPNMEESRNV